MNLDPERENLLSSNSTISPVGNSQEQSNYGSSSENQQSTSIDMAAPKDRLKVVYIFFYILGLGTLLPWNFFITANEYWMFKLQDDATDFYTSSNAEDANTTSVTNSTDIPPPTPQYNSLQSLFQNALSICAMLPNVIFQFLNTALQQKIKENKRVIGSIFIMIICFIFTTALVKVDTTTWTKAFFAVTMFSVVLLNCCSAIFQSSIFGMCGSLPSIYMQAVMAGQGMGGVFASLSMIVAISFSSDPTTSALIYFITAIAVLIITAACYLSLAKNEFYKYYKSPSRSSKGNIINTEIEEKNGDVWVRKASTYDDTKESTALTENLPEVEVKAPVPPLWQIMKKIWPHAFSIFFTFFVTLACFPSITANVKSMESGTPWNDKYFTPVTCFLMFNLCDWVGRSIAGYVHIPSEKHRVALLLCVLARGSFLALFLLCNVQPRSIAVVFKSDVYFILFMIIFGISNGHLSTLSMQYGPRMVEIEHAGTAGSMLGFMISVGLAAGAGFSFVLKMAVS